MKMLALLNNLLIHFAGSPVCPVVNGIGLEFLEWGGNITFSGKAATLNL